MKLWNCEIILIKINSMKNKQTNKKTFENQYGVTPSWKKTKIFFLYIFSNNF